MKEQVARADTEKMHSKNLFAEFCEESEQLMVRLNVARDSRNRVEKLTRSLVAESVNAVNSVLQQMAYDTVIQFQERFERTYSTVRVPFPVYLTRVSGVAATSIPWKGKKAGMKTVRTGRRSFYRDPARFCKRFLSSEVR